MSINICHLDFLFGWNRGRIFHCLESQGGFIMRTVLILVMLMLFAGCSTTPSSSHASGHDKMDVLTVIHASGATDVYRAPIIASNANEAVGFSKSRKEHEKLWTVIFAETDSSMIDYGVCNVQAKHP